ncbi:MAG: hypothetical protein AAGF85_00260 [Bacteroidota bacterium]
MDNDILKILSEKVGETRRLANAAEKKADAAIEQAKASWAQVDQLRELVLISRNEMQENIAYLKYLKLPWWKRLFGTPEH